MPDGAVKGGQNEKKENIFICSIKLGSIKLVGKINPKHKVCYVPLNGKEKSLSKYSTLVVDTLNEAKTDNIDREETTRLPHSTTTTTTTKETTTPVSVFITSPVHKFYKPLKTAAPVNSPGRQNALYSRNVGCCKLYN